MKRITIVILILTTTVLIACNQKNVSNLEFNKEDYYETLTTNDALIRDICVLEYNIFKTNKSKYSGYLINERDELIIFHTGFKRSEIVKYKELINSRKVTFKKVKYSLETLNSVLKIAKEQIRTISDNEVNISTLSVDTLNNRIMIGLYGNVSTEKSKFLNYFDEQYHKYFMFVYEDPLVLQLEDIFHNIKSLRSKPGECSKLIGTAASLVYEMKWINA